MPAWALSYRGFGIGLRVPERLPGLLRAGGRRLPRSSPDGVEIRPAPPVFARPRDPTDAGGSVLAYYGAGRERPLPEPGALAALPLERQVAATRWYHTIELPGGVVTPGAFDHRPVVPHYGIPDDLRGRRCLDAACSNGFWAFELERRGGEVVAVDVPTIADWDLPAGTPPLDARDPDALAAAAFAIAHRALGSRVELVRRNLYEMDPEDLGTFDLVHMADVLLHLRNPLDALRRLRGLVADGGSALIADVFDPALAGPVTRYSGGFRNVIWWTPSLDCLVQMVYDAGFGSVDVVTTYSIPGGAGWRAAMRARP